MENLNLAFPTDPRVILEYKMLNDSFSHIPYFPNYQVREFKNAADDSVQIELRCRIRLKYLDKLTYFWTMVRKEYRFKKEEFTNEKQVLIETQFLKMAYKETVCHILNESNVQMKAPNAFQGIDTFIYVLDSNQLDERERLTGENF